MACQSNNLAAVVSFPGKNGRIIGPLEMLHDAPENDDTGDLDIEFWEKEEGNPTREEIHEMDRLLEKRKMGFSLKGNLEMKK